MKTIETNMKSIKKREKHMESLKRLESLDFARKATNAWLRADVRQNAKYNSCGDSKAVKS